MHPKIQGSCQGNVREINIFSRSGKCQGILWCVRENWNFAKMSGKCQGIFHLSRSWDVWSRCIFLFFFFFFFFFFFAKFVKFSAPVMSGKFEFVSGKCQGIVKKFWSVLNVWTLFIPIFSFWPGAMIDPQWFKIPLSKTVFYGPKDVQAIEVWLYFIFYTLNIIGLLHWYWWILSWIGISKLGSFDFLTRDKIHQYQYNNPFII